MAWSKQEHDLNCMFQNKALLRILSVVSPLILVLVTWVCREVNTLKCDVGEVKSEVLFLVQGDLMDLCLLAFIGPSLVDSVGVTSE